MSDAQQQDEKNVIIGLLYKHSGIASAAAKEIGVSADSFRRRAKACDIDLKEFKEQLKASPDFAELMKHYSVIDVPAHSGAKKAVMTEIHVANMNPSDGRTVADIQDINSCPHCISMKSHDQKTFGVGVFMSRTFECGTSINRMGHLNRTRTCLRIEARNTRVVTVYE